MDHFLLDVTGANQYSVKKQRALLSRIGHMAPLLMAKIGQSAGEFHCTPVVQLAPSFKALFLYKLGYRL